jgi:hypothetical protein
VDGEDASEIAGGIAGVIADFPLVRVSIGDN